MKKEAEKLLLTMSDYIKSNTLLDDITSRILLEYIEQILTIEQNETKVGKFDFYSFASKDKLRPAMMGIYHKDGYRYSTDAHALIRVKAEYNETLEGKILFKDGTIKELHVPNYNNVIPDITKRESMEIDLSDITKYDAETKTHKKIYGKNAIIVFKHPDGNYYTYDLYVKCLRACKEYGVTNMFYSPNAKNLLLFHNDVCDIILTPMRVPDNVETNREEYDYVKIYTI